MPEMYSPRINRIVPFCNAFSVTQLHIASHCVSCIILCCFVLVCTSLICIVCITLYCIVLYCDLFTVMVLSFVLSYCIALYVCQFDVIF